MPKFIDLTNQIFHKWVVLERDKNSLSKNTHWKCRCVCGYVGSIDTSHLTSGRSKSCRRCSETKDKGQLNSKLWNQINRNAVARNIPISVTKEFLYDLLVKQQRNHCALSGLYIAIATTVNGHKRKRETTASLDRIDSTKGYTEDNVQWIHKDINRMKSYFDTNYFMWLCAMITDKANLTKHFRKLFGAEIGKKYPLECMNCNDSDTPEQIYVKTGGRYGKAPTEEVKRELFGPNIPAGVPLEETSKYT